MFSMFRRRQHKREDGDPVIAFLLLEKPVFPLQEALRRLAGQPYVGAGFTPPEPKDSVAVFQVGAETVAVSVMPGPYPWSDLEGPCATAWMFPEAADALRNHGGHLLVAMMNGKGTPVERRVLLTRLISTLSAEPGVLGVYWAEGTVVHPPVVFQEMTETMLGDESYPLWLWVDFRVNRNEDGSFCLFTTGMKALGLMEIEVPSSRMEPAELREYVSGIALYLVNNGMVIKDGHTVGRTEDEHITARYAKSMWDRPEKVLRLEM